MTASGPLAPTPRRWPRAALITVVVAVVLVLASVSVLAVALLSGSSGESPEAAQVPSNTPKPDKAQPSPSQTRTPTVAGAPTPMPGPASESPADEPADVAAPLAPEQPPAPVQPVSGASPAQPACPPGTVVVTNPTGLDVQLDPQYEAQMTRLGMTDLLVPTATTTNTFTAGGGLVTNGTTAALHLANPPNAVLVGVSDVRAFGDRSMDMALAPGESVVWGASGHGVFIRANVSGALADVYYLGPQWESPVPGCPSPTVRLG